MKLIKQISEDEVITHFLQTEIRSDRFSKKILEVLKFHKVSRALIDDADFSNKEDSLIRKQVLKYFRTSTFHNFPEEVKWFRALLTKDELKRVRYIDYSYWNELSTGTSLPLEAAKNINNGLVVYDQGNEGFLKAAEYLKQGGKLPDPILVAEDENSQLVILEGHLRFTAYFLAEDFLPSETEVIVGFSKDIDKWNNGNGDLV